MICHLAPAALGVGCLFCAHTLRAKQASNTLLVVREASPREEESDHSQALLDGPGFIGEGIACISIAYYRLSVFAELDLVRLFIVEHPAHEPFALFL